MAAILNFIADHPGQAFALTELVRALKLSRATCHALLTGLVDVGYLYRTSDKTYVLGPALAAIGRVAADHFSPLQVAKPEMRALADEFDIVCAAYFLEGEEIHLRDRAASLSHVAYPVPLGTRMPLRSAQATAFLAWTPHEAEAWLKQAEPKPGPESVTAMQEGMAFGREHGFVVLVRNPRRPFNLMTTEELNTARTDEIPVVPIGEIESSTVYAVGALMAPVFDARGKVSFVLVMAGFHTAMSGTQVMAAGERLRDACDRISGFVGKGNIPARQQVVK